MSSSKDLMIDLDWFRFERLEEHRQGATLDLWVQLSPRVEGLNDALEGRVDTFRVKVPREDWLGGWRLSLETEQTSSRFGMP